MKNEVDIYVNVHKLNKQLKIIGIINNMIIAQNTLKKIKIKLYNTLALMALLHGSENLTIKAEEAERITAAEMKYLRKRAGYTWIDHTTNTEFARELNILKLWTKYKNTEKIRCNIKRNDP
jgi:hypothetical protein